MKRTALHLGIWILLFLLIFSAIQYNRSGEVIDRLSGQIIDCTFIVGSKSGGGKIAKVKLESGENVRVLVDKCFPHLGKVRNILKKKAKFSGKEIYELDH